MKRLTGISHIIAPDTGFLLFGCYFLSCALPVREAKIRMMKRIAFDWADYGTCQNDWSLLHGAVEGRSPWLAGRFVCS